MLSDIQIHLDGTWRRIARFTPFKDQIPFGYSGCGGHLEYDEKYVIDSFQSGSPLPPVSLTIPVGFIIDKHVRWPAFLLDLLPTGAGRKRWLDRLDLRDTPAADGQLLAHGARHPVGCLRIVSDDAEREQPIIGPGFTRQDVALREQSFLEYAISLGASVAGCSTNWRNCLAVLHNWPKRRALNVTWRKYGAGQLTRTGGFSTKERTR